MMFHVGQKVVCVDVRDAPELSMHAVYTVRRVSESYGWFQGQYCWGVGILVYEVDPVGSDEFVVARFRPIKRTNISIFTSMLNNVPLHVKERV